MTQIKLRSGWGAIKHTQAGLSLVELMIALTIGLVLLAALGAIFLETSKNRAELDKSGRQIENGRYAMQVLSTDIQHAGFYGQFFSPSAPGSIPNDCGSSNPADSAMQAGMALAVFGYSQPSTAPGCVSATSLATGNDILVIRRASTTAEDKGVGTQTGLYLQSTSDSCVLGLADDTTGISSGTPCKLGPLTLPKVITGKCTPASASTLTACIRKYLVHVYFIDNVSGIPTLKRMVYGSSGYTAESLVDGIERMVVDYGIDTTGDGAPDSYSRDPGTAADWFNVVSVRISLLARNTETTPGHTDLKTYTLGDLGSVGPFNDNYKRHVYTQVVRVNNVGLRRESEP